MKEVILYELGEFEHEKWFYEVIDKVELIFEGKNLDIKKDIELPETMENKEKRFYSQLGMLMLKALLNKYHPLYYENKIKDRKKLISEAVELSEEHFSIMDAFDRIEENYEIIINNLPGKSRALKEMVFVWQGLDLDNNLDNWNTPIYNIFKEIIAKNKKEFGLKVGESLIATDIYISEKNVCKKDLEKLPQYAEQLCKIKQLEKGEEIELEGEELGLSEIKKKIKRASKIEKIVLYETYAKLAQGNRREKRWLENRIEEIRRKIEELKMLEDEELEPYLLAIEKFGEQELWGRKLYENIKPVFKILNKEETINGPLWYVEYYHYLLNKISGKSAKFPPLSIKKTGRRKKQL